MEQQGVLYYLPSSLTEINFGGGRISCNFLENVDKVKRVSLEGIWEIGGYAFRNCAGIERIILPDTVAVIGDGAFENCQSLLSIEISPDSQLTDIGSYAFANNWALKEIYLPQGVNAVKNSAFSDCVSLTDISFQAVSRIEDYAFYRCFALNEVNLPAHIEYIGAYAFYDCKQAEFSYQKFDSLAHIGSFAFSIAAESNICTPKALSLSALRLSTERTTLKSCPCPATPWRNGIRQRLLRKQLCRKPKQRRLLSTPSAFKGISKLASLLPLRF